MVEVVLDVTEDDDGGLDLDRVADATRAVSDALDAADIIVGEYTLDVMSPGVDRALTSVGTSRTPSVTSSSSRCRTAGRWPVG